MTETLTIIPLEDVTEVPAEVNPAYVYENRVTPTGPSPLFSAEERARILQALPAGMADIYAAKIEQQADPEFQPQAFYEDGPYEEGMSPLRNAPPRIRKYIGARAVSVFAALLEKKQLEAAEN